MGEDLTKGIGEAVTVEEPVKTADVMNPAISNAPVGDAPAAEVVAEVAAAPQPSTDIVPDPRRFYIALDLGSSIVFESLPPDEQPRQMFLTIAGVRWMHVGEYRGVWLYRPDK